jgi:hypothetical protein
MGGYGVVVVNTIVRVGAAVLGAVGLIKGAEQETCKEEGEGDGSEEQKGDEVDKQSEEARE